MRHGSRVAAMAAVVVSGLLVSTQLRAADEKPSAQAKIGEKAPDFALKDAFGKEHKLSDYRGKIVVLEWINQQCPVSKGKHTKQTMQESYKKHADQVVWLAIDTKANDPEKNRVYAAKMGIAYPILHDTDGKVGRAYNARTTPHMFVIDKEGKLVYDGAIDDKGETNYVDNAIHDLLEGKTVSKPKTEPYGCGVKY